MPLSLRPDSPSPLSPQRRHHPGTIAASTALLIGLAIAGGTAPAQAAPAVKPGVQAPASPPPAPAQQNPFGSNTYVFDPSMPVAQIQATVDAIAAQQVDDEMGTKRYSLLFKPGTYGTPEEPLIVQVGYSTEVAGLGAAPTDVTINGHVDVYNRCLTADNCIALNNFWRSLSNLTINVTGLEGCRSSANFWAASQASPMRRVNITGGNLSLMDYCTAGPQYASGGFIADSKTGAVINGSQQQYLVRDSSIGSWSNGVWNQVFSGVNGAPADSFPDPPYTTLDTTPISREKPYPTVDPAGQYSVFVPSVRQDSAGTTWEYGPTQGRSIPLAEFYIAKPGDSVQAINTQLARGKNLILTPGVYDVDRSIEVKRAGTVVLGLGMATLTAVNGSVPLTVADVPGVDIAAVTVDAGEVNSPALMRVGKAIPGAGGGPANSAVHSDPANPTTLHDVFFRIGGPHVGKASVSLEVNSDNVLLDHIWAWRADHGNGVGWDTNTGRNGVIVNGNNVTATGLFVEHYQQYNVIWNGENGRTVFFQNELPYDAPNQAAWQHDGVLGWAGYKVADPVKTHELWGGGSYVYNNVDPTIHATRGFEVPVTPGVTLHSLLTVNLGAGTLDHVVNDTGAPVSTDAVGIPSYVADFG
ncbi:adenylyl cyclase [Pseudarthrobacter sp. C4D7]|uniref:adenylyl cyclase n=1 Tax=Pseudarthrobacter sp. C4D7 TaxID=2735268 RepID=UPI001585D218|nr:adenylyl cyclase [Pseudarthrobacter sp. C4D7]NUT71401.1 adenylyl cyclase [Pseudarthrobacter sp. C4D7]